jgi:hypothetical protein
MKQPSDFIKTPWSSRAGSSEAETIAVNIMVILKRTGNQWRNLSWDEYAAERKKDGNFTQSEQKYFNEVIDFCQSPETAKLFSLSWK